MANLTDQQKKIVSCRDCPVMVIAGACTGKTTVVANRFIYLCSHSGISPDRILCLSFTNASVNELKDLIIQLWCDEKREVTNGFVKIQTIYQLCQRIILDDCERKGIDVPGIFRLSASKHAVQKSFRSHEVPFVNIPNNRIIEKLRWLCKSQQREFTQDDVNDVIAKLAPIPDRNEIPDYFPVEHVREMYQKFEDELASHKSITLDDIILDARNLLQDPEILERWSSKYDAILCDEFQDLDEVQFDILMKLCNRHNNIFCVGNPFQSLSGARKNFFQPFDEFEGYFQSFGIGYETHKLEENFRSTPEILNVVNQLVIGSSIDSKFKNHLFTHNPNSSKVTLDISSSSVDQAYSVVEQVSELLNQGVSAQDIAILSRGNSQGIRSITNHLLCSQINYIDLIKSSNASLNQELKYLMHWFNVAFLEDTNEQWVVALTRIYHTLTVKVSPIKFRNCFAETSHPKGYLKALEEAGKKDFDIFAMYKKIKSIRSVARNSNKTLKERCLAIAMVSGIKDYYIINRQEERAQNIERFLNSSLFNEESWEVLAQQINDYLSQFKNQLTCGTIQSTKEMEFDHVFLVSMSDDSKFRQRVSQMCNTPEEEDKYIEEERRMMYVACTRARKTLHIFSDKEQVSSFVQEIMPYLELRAYSEKI